MGMLTRKQQWRRTRTRNKRAWGDLPPEVLEAMLSGGGNMSKSVSWDQSFAAALRERAEQSRAEAIRVAATTAAAAATTAAATARSGHQGDGRKAAAANTRHPGAADSVPEQHIPRSVSCSSLEVRRTLFPRSSSRDELGMTRKAGFGGRRGSDGRRGVLHRRGVSFDTQVKMVLIPKRDEFNETERGRLWWGREDYARFRQVLIDWKRRNAHRISHSDNILSIDLAELDRDDDEDESNITTITNGNNHAVANGANGGSIHDETIKAADATVAAEAVAVTTHVQAAAQAAAEAHAKAAAIPDAAAVTAAAAAAATAAATAIELAASNARDEAYAAAAAGCNGRDPMEEDARSLAAKVEEERKYDQSWGGQEAGVAQPPAESFAAATAGGKVVRSEFTFSDGGDDGSSILSDISEEDPEEPDSSGTIIAVAAAVIAAAAGEKAIETVVLHKPFASFTLPRPRGAPVVPDWSVANPGDGMMPLRRAFSEIGEEEMSHSSWNGNTAAARLTTVPLSDMQATVESLRAWRQTLDSRRFALAPSIYNKVDGEEGEDDSDERGRSVSLQGHKIMRCGRATARLEDGETLDGVKEHCAQYACRGNGACWTRGQGGEQGGKGLNQVTRAASAAGTGNVSGDARAAVIKIASSMTGFDRQGRGKEAQTEELEARQVASAASMVEAAASVATATVTAVAGDGAKSQTEATTKQPTTAGHMPPQEPESAGSVDGSSKRATPGGEDGVNGDGADEALRGMGEERSRQVIELGLNDAPGSATAAAAVGIRMAAEGVSNLSLRARDSVENLQEMAKQNWSQVPLSFSA